jgi:hypothetical protein
LGRSRNKVAVPEGAAGSPPFWSQQVLARGVRPRGATSVSVDHWLLITAAQVGRPGSSSRGARPVRLDQLRWWALCAALRARTLERPITRSHRDHRHTWRQAGRVGRPAILENSRASASNLYGKQSRAHDGCLGTESRRRTWEAAISPGEELTIHRSRDVRMGKPGWGHAQSTLPEHIGQR